MATVDRISEVYRGERGTPKVQQRERARIDWLVSRARGEVLDLGCSQGIAAVLCARRGLRALGVDVHPERISYALAERGHKPPGVRDLLDFQVGDASRLELDDASFDTVLLGGLLEQADDLDPVLREAARVTRRDGVIAISVGFGFDPDREHRRTFYLASLVDALAPRLTVDSIEIEEGTFRVIASPGAMPEEAKRRLIVEMQPRLEEALAETDQEAALVRERRRRLAHAVRHLDRVARRASWRLAVIRASRWWRLGTAFSAARNRRGLLGLPRALVNAGRRLPQPRKEAGERWRKRENVDRGTAHAELTADADRLLEVSIPAAELPDGPVARPELTAAVICDRFSATALRYEWHQVQFGPEDWLETLEREHPDLLFVESAWRGNDGRWHELLKGRSRQKRQPLIDLLAWCRQRGIPTVFWNKEDPPNFGHFAYTAKLFDHLFTVDGDCIPRYAEVLGREDVDVLPFGAQPRIHNPISVAGGRAHDVVFAGTYFPRKHPGRRRQMETILAPAREFDLHIYSRIVPGSDERFEWPPEYRPHVVGSLPYERMLAAYKAYKVFLNVNSVTDSPTMCARRVFELSACSTPVLSGYSRAIEETFGELITVARTQEETRARLSELLGDAETRERRAHLALREVLTKHTYRHRVDRVLGAAGIAAPLSGPSVSVLLRLDRAEDADRALEQVAAQAWRPLQLVAITAGGDLDPARVGERAQARGIENVATVPASSPASAGWLNAALDAATGDLIAIFDPASSYEEHYLTDLVQAFSYTEAEIAGKQAHYATIAGGDAELRFADQEHSYVDRVHPSTLVATAELLRRLRFDEGSPAPVEDLLGRTRAEGGQIYSADRFSFVAPGPERGAVSASAASGARSES